MSQVTQEREIDGMSFAVTQLPGMRGLKLLARLGRVLGPAVAKALAGASNGLKGEVDFEVMGEAVGTLFERLTEKELEEVTRELLQAATVDNRPLLQGFDVTMQGKTLTILKVLLFAFEVNYGSFLDVLKDLGAKHAKASKGSSSKASTISTTPGPAGG